MQVAWQGLEGAQLLAWVQAQGWQAALGRKGYVCPKSHAEPAQEP